MFKRILVLILFLSGAFWFLSQRGNDVEPTPVVESEVREMAENGETPENLLEAAQTSEDAEEKSESVGEVEEKPVIVEVEAAPVVVRPKPKLPNNETTVKVYLYEWDIDFSKRTIPAGTVHFQVQNNGRFAHNFGLGRFGVQGELAPGEEKTFTIRAYPGSYEAFSNRREDYGRGMKDTLVLE